MPYAQHQQVETPPIRTLLWRYMSFVKLASLLETRSLWFSRVDLFDDPFEGSLFANTTITGAVNLNATLTDVPVPLQELDPDMRAFLTQAQDTIIDQTFLSCWYAREHDSVAMLGALRKP
jgi:hypothetical protein